MKTTTREYLHKIDYMPWNNEAVSIVFFWALTNEGQDYWSKVNTIRAIRGKTHTKAARKLRQLRKAAFRCGYRNKLSHQWRA